MSDSQENSVTFRLRVCDCGYRMMIVHDEISPESLRKLKKTMGRERFHVSVNPKSCAKCDAVIDSNGENAQTVHVASDEFGKTVAAQILLINAAEVAKKSIHGCIEALNRYAQESPALAESCCALISTAQSNGFDARQLTSQLFEALTAAYETTGRFLGRISGLNRTLNPRARSDEEKLN